MTKNSRKVLRWQKMKIVNWGCLSLASALFLSSCGGGYDGGAQFNATPTPIAAPPQQAEPTAPPTPEPLAKTGTPRETEWLDRGIIAIPTSKGNIISWRLLGTDSPATTFDVFKNGSKLNPDPIANKTFYKDLEGTPSDAYHVVAMAESSEAGTSKTVSPWPSSYLGIPLNRPPNSVTSLGEEYSYSANDASAADLDGDGQYEIILKWMPSNAKDNAHSGLTGNAYIDAYTLEGKQLWRIDLGHNIRSGAHYNPFIVFDFDGDGRAELAVKTADGSIDGQGTVIGDAEADYRQANGYILSGPEFLTMFDGLSGEALDTIDYNPPRGVVGDWGDDYGNRVDRFLAGVAYLDGQKPSLLMSRGYYGRAVIATYNWVDGAFEEGWVFDTNDGAEKAELIGQGNHQLSIADVDNDGKDEIIFGAATIDDNGDLLYNTGLGHGDALHVGDFDPNREGLEVYGVHESPSEYREFDTDGTTVLSDHGSNLRAAEDGSILWSRPGGGDDVGRGVSTDIDPRYPGNESWSSRNGLVAADGTQLLGGPGADSPHEEPSSINFAAWWDGDLLREMLNGTVVSKWDYANTESHVILNASTRFNATSNNGTKSTPSLSADILGDWREEIIWASADQNMLMVFSATAETDYRFLTLMHDSQYRTAIAWQNVGYNQPPHPSFYIGPGSVPVWEANIATTEGKEWAKLVSRGRSDSIEVQVYTNAFEVESIQIMRSTNPEDPAPETVFTLEGDARTWVDSDVEAETTYYYWAELVGSTATSEMALNTSKAQLQQGAPPLLVAFATELSKSPFQVEVSWTAANMEPDSIEVYRGFAADASDRSLIATLDGSATSFTDTAPDIIEDNYYWVIISEADEDVFESNATLPITLGPIANITTQLIGATDANNNRVSAIKVSWELANFPYPFASIELYRNDQDVLTGRTRVNPSVADKGEFIDFFEEGGPGIEGQDYWYMFKIQMDTGEVDENNNPILQRFDTDPEAQIAYSTTIPPSASIETQLVYVDDGNGGQTPAVEVKWNLQDFPSNFTSIELYRNDQNELGGRTRVNPAAEPSGTFIDVFTDGGPAIDGQDYWYMFKIGLEGEIDSYNTNPEGKVTYKSVIDPSTNLATELSPEGVKVTWNLSNFLYPLTSIELYRNTANQLGDRTRLLTGLAESGEIIDDGTLGNNLGDAPLVEGQDYWYMFKITQDTGGGATETYNSDPEGRITYQVIAAPPAGADNTLEVEMESLSAQASFASFEVVSDATASGGSYASWVDDGTDPAIANPDLEQNTYVVINFFLTEETTVNFDFLLDLPTPTADSFHWRFDDEEWALQNDTLTTGWETLEAGASQTLSVGSHSLTIQAREAGAKFDKVILTPTSGLIASE